MTSFEGRQLIHLAERPINGPRISSPDIVRMLRKLRSDCWRKRSSRGEPFFPFSINNNSELVYSEDMIDLLGKRPFVNQSDDMDKWLDQHGGRERSAPPPLEEPAPGPVDPTPAPVATSTRIEDK